MTAPTEAEVRAAIVGVAESSYVGSCVDEVAGLRFNLGAMAKACARALVDSAAGTKELDDGVLWVDLRPSEADRLITLVSEAADRATERCEAIILDAMTAAGVAFAAEFPEAPRGEAAEAVV